MEEPPPERTVASRCTKPPGATHTPGGLPLETPTSGALRSPLAAGEGPLTAELGRHQRGIHPALREQLLMCPPLQERSVLHREDEVRVDHGAQAAGDDHARAADARQPPLHP